MILFSVFYFSIFSSSFLFLSLCRSMMQLATKKKNYKGTKNLLIRRKGKRERKRIEEQRKTIFKQG